MKRVVEYSSLSRDENVWSVSLITSIMLIHSRWCESFSVFLLYLSWLIKPISSQGLACYKCMTLNPNDEECSDPFSSINSPIQINCQVTGNNAYAATASSSFGDFFLVKSNYILTVRVSLGEIEME